MCPKKTHKKTINTMKWNKERSAQNELVILDERICLAIDLCSFSSDFSGELEALPAMTRLNIMTYFTLMLGLLGTPSNHYYLSLVWMYLGSKIYLDTFTLAIGNSGQREY
jgi:hypothetical protein